MSDSQASLTTIINTRSLNDVRIIFDLIASSRRICHILHALRGYGTPDMTSLTPARENDDRLPRCSSPRYSIISAG